MTIRFHTLLLALLLLGSIAVSRLAFDGGAAVETPHVPVTNAEGTYEASLTGQIQVVAEAPPGPARRWEVLDPVLMAEAAMVQSLNGQHPFLNYRTYTEWPLASLTKLITALVVLEDIGPEKKIPISEAAVATEGNGGGLTPGEVYTARALVKILLHAASKDAAFAFEEFMGGRATFVRLMTKKAEAIGMARTLVHDASGLSELNVSTASDLLKLARYITSNAPDIFAWTRLSSFIAQPLNGTESATVENINPFVTDRDFLGGKTGTSDEARQNLLAIFSYEHYRVAVIILGSSDRVREVNTIRSWLGKAYMF